MLMLTNKNRKKGCNLNVTFYENPVVLN